MTLLACRAGGGTRIEDYSKADGWSISHKTSIGRETAGHLLVKFSTEDTSQITDLRVGATPNVTPLGPGPLVPEHRMKADKKKHHGA